MDPKEIRTLHLLEEIEKNHMPSQRHLARQLNISLGLVNSFVKRLAQKGFFKITHIPKNRVKYILTPKGAAEKTRLTYEYIKYSYTFYRDARKKLRNLFSDFEAQGVSSIVFYGVGDLAEIAFVSLQETNMNLVAILDDQLPGNNFLGFRVRDPDDIDSIAFEKILITSIEAQENVLANLKDKNFPSELIATLS